MAKGHKGFMVKGTSHETKRERKHAGKKGRKGHGRKRGYKK